MAESDVVRVAREYREQLARNEHEALRRMSRYWVKIEKKLQNDLEALAREVLDRQAKGQAVPRQFIYTLQRYRSMVEQVSRELPGYQSTVEDLIKEYQRKDYLLGLDAANAEIKATKPSSDVWTRVYKDAAETMAGFAGNGAPLYELLRHDYAETSESILDALVEGVARGKGYQEVAKDMRDAMGMEYDRSLRIARTEINRSYRLANAEQYRRSGVVEKVLRLCYKPTACFACLMLDGEECPKGICDDHPNGKCTTIVTTTGGVTPEWQTGSEWFEEQSPEDQRRIMGAGRYELWKNEGVNPRSMVWMKPNPIWGGSPSVKTFDMMGVESPLKSKKDETLSVSEHARLYRNNSYNVPLQALDAPGFIEKFKNITGNPDTDEVIYESAVEILKHRNGTDGEDLFLIDMDTGEEIHRNMTSKGGLGVHYDEETKQAIADAHKNGQRIVAIHNHPNGLPPTLDDGSTAIYRGYDLGVAVGHNLEVWTFGKADQAYKKNFCTAVHDALNEKILYLPQFDEDEWYNTLRKYGMEVKRL